jgi:tetratricopeptide (TPR) repeat protein
VGGASTLRHWTLFYAANPPPSSDQLLVGENVIQLPHVDYLFEIAPANLQVDKNQQITKTQLEIVNVEPLQALHLVEQENPGRALQVAERLIRRYPDQAMLLHEYVELAEKSGRGPQAEAVLKAGLEKRPVNAPWHRAYQTLLQNSGREPQLREQYQQLLQADPQNARLMYLMGRVEQDHARARELFEASAAAEPNFGWPWFALSYDAMSAADWPTAWECAKKARECRMDPTATAVVWHMSGLGAGETQVLEQEYRSKMGARPIDLQNAMLLCDVLAASGKPEETKAVFQQIQMQLAGGNPTVQRALVSIRETVNYLLGDLSGLEAPRIADLATIDSVYGHYLLAAGRPEEAASAPSLKESWQDAWQALSLSIAFSLAGRDAEADEWRKVCCDKLDKGDTDSVRSAGLLRSETAPDFSVLSAVVHAPSQKALLLVALGIRFPELRSQCHELASKLNVSRMPPYLLLNRALTAPAP